jgi:hypothetical protein
MVDETDNSEYLFIIDYDSDAERKRIEYLFNNLEEGTSRSPRGLVRLADGVNHDELYEQLVAKVPEDQVSSYRLEPIETNLEPERVIVEKTINAPRDAVEPFVEYILSKRNAVLQSASHNEYEVYTKKGRADVSYRISDENGTITVSIHVSGYPPAPEFLGEFFETELADYARSQA